MDSGFKVDKECPRANTNIFSRMFFVWMVKYFYNGVKRGINSTDLYKTATSDSSEYLADRLEKNWNKELARAKTSEENPSLTKAVIKTFVWQYMIYGVILFLQYCGLRVFQPLVLGFFLRLFNGTTDVDDPELAKYLTGLVMILVGLLGSFMQHHTNFGQQTVGMKVRVAVSALVYRKMLKLSQKSLGETAAGKVVNLLANDVNRFDIVATAMHFFWITPFQVGIVSYFIWREVGIACLAGIITLIILTLPVQTLMGKLSSKFRRKVAIRTDYRIRLMNEIISGIQVIKMYAWEKPFEKLTTMARLNEMKMIRLANYVRAVFLSAMVFIERLTLYATLITFVLMDNNLSSDITYTISPYFSLLQMCLAVMLPIAIQFVAEARVSLNRLQEFLMLQEREETNIVNTNDKSIEFNKVSAKWSEEMGILENINVNIPPGSLCALIGTVGAGKSSALQLVLGELATESGEIKVGGNISYASQEPWLFGSTVRGNITFGQDYDKQWYNKVIKVCALEKDFKQFPQGDQTMVGERGVSLSGGQRARINLARAIYRKADIYLLDDPLSAVDTHVGRHLFDECVMKHLRGKTRILVTHQLQYLKQADLIVVISNGTIEAQGTFDELKNSKSDFSRMLVAADETTEEDLARSKKMMLRQESVTSVSSTETNGEPEVEVKRAEEEVIIPETSVLWDYLRAVDAPLVVAILVLIIVSCQSLASVTDYYVSWWTEQEETRNAEELLNGTSSLNTFYDAFQTAETGVINTVKGWFGITTNYGTRSVYLLNRADADNLVEQHTAIYIYTGFIAGLIGFTVIRAYLFFKCASDASKNLHAEMFNCLLKSPMRFFDTNPSGRVLNRFSKDTGGMDEALPRVLNETMTVVLSLIGAIVLIVVSNYWMAIPIVVLLLVFNVLRKWYMVTAKSIKHVEGIAKSPVFSLLNSTLGGISTIRASNAQVDLIKEFDTHQNVHTSAWILALCTGASFGLWLDFICSLFTAIIVFGFVILSETSGVSGAIAGLAISQAMGLAGMLQMGMRQTSEVVNQLAGVERVMTYTRLPQEGPFESPNDKKPTIEWPKKGKIQFKNMSLRYDVEDVAVLKNLSIEVKPGEKVGIVGRTGAGKSSLISALFRLAPLEGGITIDDIDTQQIGLHDVRSNISIIPQEPVLFSAPMRYNLDPFGEFSDQELWSALSEVELKEAVPSLDYRIAEGGSNFSVGQRQLICLARAIIRNNKILVLDEATANVDPRTDGLIQATIRRKFKECTVLTIAHRLNTIMDSDKVLVMDLGYVAEFDHPHLLLQKPEGHFTKLVMETGPAMTATLRGIAQQCYENNMDPHHAKKE